MVPGNTLASFDAALELGVDMIEFDVRACGRELVLAHYPWSPRRRACPSLREALDHLARPRFALKRPPTSGTKGAAINDSG